MSYPNITLTEQENIWIGEFVGRLRSIQADAATIVPEKRREYLQEEVARGLKSTPSNNRKRLLEALLARFPVAGQIVRSVPLSSEPAPMPVEETPDQLLERFMAAAADFPAEKRTELSKRLHAAGFGVERSAPAIEISEELRQALAIPAGQQPCLTKVVELAALLIDIFQRSNDMAHAALRELSPRNPMLERSQTFRSVVVRFLVEEDKTLALQLRLASGVPATMLAAIKGDEKKKSAAAFVRLYEERFSSRAIEDVVEAEGAKMFGPSKKERCWDRYKELSKDLADPALIDRYIKDCLGKVVDESLRRLGEANAARVR